VPDSLHIFFISPFFPLKGGIARFSTSLRNALLRRGPSVDAYSFIRLYPRLFSGMKSPFEPGSDRQQDPDILALIDLLNPLTWIGTAFRIRRSRSGVVFGAYWTGLLAPLYIVVRKFSGRPFVLLMHNYSSHEPWLNASWLRRMMIRSADGVVTLSRHVAGQVAGAHPDKKVIALFHPVYESAEALCSPDQARRRIGLGGGGPVLLFFGYVRRYKGLDILFEAIPDLLLRHPGLQLVVAGQFYESLQRYRDLAIRLGIDRNVNFFPGFASRQETALYFSAADAVVLPYRTASQSGVVQEAYGFQRPVVVTAAGGLGEAVEHGRTGWIVDRPGSAALAEGILDFLDTADREKVTSSIASYCREHSWDRLASAVDGFLQEEILA